MNKRDEEKQIIFESLKEALLQLMDKKETRFQSWCC